MVEQCYHRNVLYKTVKNKYLWKNKKQKYYKKSLRIKTTFSHISLSGKILF